MKIEIKATCDCKTEFTVKLPDSCYEKGYVNSFVLKCPHCQEEGKVEHRFEIETL